MATLISATGPDTLTQATAADDTLVGTSGTDTLLSTFASTDLFGLQGNDFLQALGTTDVFAYGGQGDDSLTAAAGGGKNRLFGDKGNDTVVGGPVGNDTLYGGEGNDTIIAGSKTVGFGNQGKDSLFGSTGATLYGGQGNDTLLGTGGGALFGNKDNDTLTGKGGDTLYGGEGNDTITTTVALLAYGNQGKDSMVGSTGATLYGGQDGDFLTGGSTTLAGGALLYGDKGSDSLFATGAGTGGTGKADTLFGGDDNDYLAPVKDGTNFSAIGEASLVASGGGGGDTIFGTNKGDSLLGGGPGGDTLDGDDTIYGRSGDDTIAGNAGNDSLFGGIGFDNIVGGKGDDSLFGGPNGQGEREFAGGGQLPPSTAKLDTLTGGDGADVFMFVGFTSPADPNQDSLGFGNIGTLGQLGIDVITDFQAGIDRIALDVAGGSFTASGFGQALFNLQATTNPAVLLSVSIVTVADPTGAIADASDGVIVFNSVSGALYFNPQGPSPTDFTGSGQSANPAANATAGLFAILQGADGQPPVNLSTNDFLLV